MASHYFSARQQGPWCESPAKAFAKLKLKVQTETLWRVEELPTAASRPRRAASLSSPSEPSDCLEVGSWHSEAQALTLSPIPSPSPSPPTASSSHTEGEPPAVGEAPRGEFLESTAVSHPFPRKTPGIRDFEGCNVSKIRGKSLFAEDSVFSPMKKRLRKRVLPPQVTGGRNVSEGTKKPKRQSDRQSSSQQPAGGQPEDTPVFPPPAAHTGKCYSWVLGPCAPVPSAQMFLHTQERENQRKHHDNRTYVLNGGELDQFHVRKSPEPVAEDAECSKSEFDLRRDASLHAAAPQPGLSREEAPLPSRYRARVVQNAPMSPAKVFALMKDRGNKKEPRHSRRDLNNADDVHQLRDAPLSARGVEDSAEAPSDAGPGEDLVQVAAMPLPPSVLLEDPLLLNSPEVFVPRRHQAAFKSKWPSNARFPSESVIYLQKWCLKRISKGLYVDGIHCSENIRWNSNVIAERVSLSVLKTVSGRIYILVGKLITEGSSDFPRWLLKKFMNGFPSNWKQLYEKFQVESRSREKKKNDGGKRNATKKTSEAPPPRAVRKKPSSPGDPGLPLGSAKVSRSGRLIIPTLDYWRGGRVVLDAQMNVTVHECYETSVAIPNTSITQPASSTRAPACLEQGGPTRGPRGKHTAAMSSNPARASKRSKSTKPHDKPDAPAETQRNTRSSRSSVDSEPEPQISSRRQKSDSPSTTASRRDKRNQKSPESVGESSGSRSPGEEKARRGRAAPHRASKQSKSTYEESMALKKPRVSTRNRRKVNPHQKPDAPAETQRNTRSSRSSVDSEPEPQISSRRQKSDSPSTTASRRDKRNQKSPESVGESSGSRSPDGDFASQRRDRRRRAGRTVQSRMDFESAEDRGKKPRENRGKAQTEPKTVRSERPRASPPAKPLQRPTQSSRKQKARRGRAAPHQDADHDKWTEAELAKLQEAVSYYPRHMLGYWDRVAAMVETRSAEECHSQHTSMATAGQRPQKATRKKVEAPKPAAADVPVISARAGTLKRKQQVRHFLEAMPRDDVDDAFSSACVQKKRFEIHNLDLKDDSDILLSALEPLTPRSASFPDAKTPQCLHITPGGMGSPNRSNDDKYVYQLQRRMKKSRFDVQKRSHRSKKFALTPSIKKPGKRCTNASGNDSFVVWEMFSGADVASPESEEEEDFYFSDS